MSSPRKDARWYLATLALENVGLEMNDLPFPVATTLLDASDRLLDLVPQDKIDEFAYKWNHEHD